MKRSDWLVALAAFLFSGAAFYYHLAPEVTLEYSGELVTGAFTFGVPHPPGYPVWTLLGYIWCKVIVPFGNPAWRIGTMSVAIGAATVGALALLMVRSTRVLLHALPQADGTDAKTKEWIALSAGVSASLLFAFNRGVWQWACVPEVRALNALAFILIAYLFFAWMLRPKLLGYLCASLFIFGMGVTTYWTVAVIAVALAAGTLASGLDTFCERRGEALQTRTFKDDAALMMPSLAMFWNLLIAALFCLAAFYLLFAWLMFPSGVAAHEVSPAATAAYMSELRVALCLIAAGVVLLGVFSIKGWVRPHHALLFSLLVICGYAFYVYVPIAASTNPPMNWAYASTKEGFLHLFTRGSYARLMVADPCDPQFITQLWVFIRGLGLQYSWWLCVFGLGSLAVSGMWVKRPGRAWMVFVWTAFLVTGIGLIIIINPRVDRLEQEITLQYFAPAHGFFAMLMGYGVAIALALARRVWAQMPRGVMPALCAGCLALPLVTYTKNWAVCSQRKHDFGYQFGYRIFSPGGGYPDMAKDAVLFGGTDPGRFIPTYMIFCESFVKPRHRYQSKWLKASRPDYDGSAFDRRDVYIITQNALADGTYMSYIRDHYDHSRPWVEDGAVTGTITNRAAWQQSVFKAGWTLLGRQNAYPKEPIKLPTPDESAEVFRQFVADVQKAHAPPNADVKIQDGRVQVSGPLGVMEINAILARWIFDRNKDTHDFYVEESYVIRWMYPHLRPAGVIMKIEKEPLPSPQQDPKLWQDIVAKDTAYWDGLIRDFLAREEFRRSAAAKKSFSKMRCAIAGLYLNRGLIGEAEYAFRQSVELCPDSPEGCFRLAELYMNTRRFEDARKLMEAYIMTDERNESAKHFLRQIEGLMQDEARRVALMEKRTAGTLGYDEELELFAAYAKMNLTDEMQDFGGTLMAKADPPPDHFLNLGILFNNARQFNLAQTALTRYTAQAPRDDWRGWVELGWACLVQGKQSEAYSAWSQAASASGMAAREKLRDDPRFKPVWDDKALPPAFRKLLPPVPARASF